MGISGANLRIVNIATYLKNAELSQAEFAKLVGVTQGRVSQWIAGETIPAERCVAIEKASNGIVTRAELRPDVFGEPQEQAA